MSGVDPARLVFVDECGTHTSMTRRRARAARGMRARGAVPRNRGPVTTLLAGVSLAGMSLAQALSRPELYGLLTGLIVSSAIASIVFLIWLRRSLRHLEREMPGPEKASPGPATPGSPLHALRPARSHLFNIGEPVRST